jgi:hypothetical protein
MQCARRERDAGANSVRQRRVTGAIVNKDVREWATPRAAAQQPCRDEVGRSRRKEQRLSANG